MFVQLRIFTQNPPKGLGRRFAQLKRETLKQVAWYWHANILQRHFTPGNSARYRMAQRNSKYKERAKARLGIGQGKYVDLILRGASYRRMKHEASVTGTQYYATLRMNAPTYFSKPFIGTYTSESGRLRHVGKQPDKPGEVKQVSADDRQQLTRFAKRGLVRGWNTGQVPSGRGA